MGRNDPCICGSGIEYKNCCAAFHHTVVQGKKTVLTEPRRKTHEPILIMTTTNEPYMPIRLYYKIKDQNALIDRLDRLQCVNWTTVEDRFLFNYEWETRNIALSVECHKIPKALFPLILAEGNLVGEYLHLDLRSFERAMRLVEFIDQQISPHIMQITDIAIHNKLQVSKPKNFKTIWHIDYNQLFSDQNISVVDLKAEFEKLNALFADIQDPDERLAKTLEENKNQALRLVEKFPVYDREEGIKWLDEALKFRILLAFEYWRKDKNYRPFDLVLRRVEGSLGIKQFWLKAAMIHSNALSTTKNRGETWRQKIIRWCSTALHY